MPMPGHPTVEMPDGILHENYIRDISRLPHQINSTQGKSCSLQWYHGSHFSPKTVVMDSRVPYYSPVGNIGDIWCLEERPYQPRHALDGAELRVDLRLELFASP
jgi:hypothetical protein